IDVYDIGADGLAGAVTVTPSAGTTPFGMAFGHDNELFVADAGSASLSSYHLTDDNALRTLSAAVPDGQAASCWITLTDSARYAYISNTGNGTISSYQVSGDGTVMLQSAVAATLGTGSAPIDSALSRDEKFLYVVDSAQGRIVGFAAKNGTLMQIGAVTGLPTSVQGIYAK